MGGKSDIQMSEKENEPGYADEGWEDRSEISSVQGHLSLLGLSDVLHIIKNTYVYYI